MPSNIHINTLGPPIKTKAGQVEFIRDRDAVVSYCKEIKKYRSLSIQEEQTLGLGIRNGNGRALHFLVQANLKFVIAVCNNYANLGMPLGDLINEGNLGLIRAAQRYEGTMNLRFISYAVWWIRQGILNALAEQAHAVNIPPNRIQTIRKTKSAKRKLDQRLGRSSSIEELAVETGDSIRSIMELQPISVPPLSLNRPFTSAEESDNKEMHLEDDHTEKPDQPALRHLLGRKLGDILNTLEERERIVIRLYYGVGYGTEHSLAEIGAKLHLTRERIRQIKDFGMQKMKRRLLRDYMAPGSLLPRPVVGSLIVR